MSDIFSVSNKLILFAVKLSRQFRSLCINKIQSRKIKGENIGVKNSMWCKAPPFTQQISIFLLLPDRPGILRHVPTDGQNPFRKLSRCHSPSFPCHRSHRVLSSR